MISLYEMTNDFKTLFDSLDAIMENDDPELDTEEMSQAWFDTLEGMELDIEEKAANVAVYIKGTLAEAEALKAERDKLSARIKAKQNAAERMKQYLLDNMRKLSRNKIETSRAVISVRNNAESVNITDEGELIDWAQGNHDEYLRYKDPEINKTAIKKALQQGEDIPGCRLERTQSVTIK